MTHGKATAPRMRRSLLGALVSSQYERLPARALLLRIAVRSEGGEMTSISLRRVLEDHFGVLVGDFAYGSLLIPGSADRGTTIGRYASIGPGVRRFGAAHPLSALSMHPFFYRSDFGLVDASHDVTRTECTIGEDAWIGAGVIILPGCHRIGAGAVVGAGSIVTRDVDDLEVVVGNPIRHIKYRPLVISRDEYLARRLFDLEPDALAKELFAHQDHPPMPESN